MRLRRNHERRARHAGARRVRGLPAHQASTRYRSWAAADGAGRAADARRWTGEEEVEFPFATTNNNKYGCGSSARLTLAQTLPRAATRTRRSAAPQAPPSAWRQQRLGRGVM